MMYQAYQNHMDLTAPWRTGAASALKYLNLVPQGVSDKLFGRLAAALELISRTSLTYTRPAYGIDKVTGRQPGTGSDRGSRLRDAVRLAAAFQEGKCAGAAAHAAGGADVRPFRDAVALAPSRRCCRITTSTSPTGITRATFRSAHGKFGLDEYTEHLITFLDKLGPRAHMVAICQPSVSALAAAAIMSEDNHPARPATLTLMAGPIDTRIQPTKVNEFAKSKPLKWFEENLINYVPFQCKGAFRQVYPGFIQLTAFVSMNLERHIKQHIDLADHLAKGEIEKAETIKTFYDEYFAVMDLPAEFYIETIRDVFQEHLLPQGKMTYRGRPVNPASIKRMGLMTVEGEKDDICSIGQTLAAQDLCTGVRAYRKVHHMQAGVGHYGVFQRPALEQRNLSAAAGFRARQFVRRRKSPHACPLG